MKRNVAIWTTVALVAGICAFAAFVWPTRYHYTTMAARDGYVLPVKIDRFTGESYRLNPARGWEKMGP